MSIAFPRYVFQGKQPDTKIVDTEIEYAAALADGWFATRDEAIDGGLVAEVPPVTEDIPPPPIVAEDAPPTRAELELKATELGIKFHPQIGNANLLKKIEEALKS